MKYVILWVLTWIALRGRIYYIWSKIYQCLYERRWRKVELPIYQDIESIENIVSDMLWRKDTWVQLWDAVSDPRATFGRHQLGEKAGDCDDISLYAVNRIDDLIERGKLLNFVEVGLLSCPWLSVDNELGGHNVCAFSYRDDENDTILWGHMSNWNGGRVFLGFESIDKIIKMVIREGGGINSKSLGWAYASPKLKLLRYGSGRDI